MQNGEQLTQWGINLPKNQSGHLHATPTLYAKYQVPSLRHSQDICSQGSIRSQFKSQQKSTQGPWWSCIIPLRILGNQWTKETDAQYLQFSVPVVNEDSLSLFPEKAF